ncbi:phenylalanine--tRNA ligase beta subunit-related protein [Streptomyces griseoincarnatus]|uniref:Phenylalanine--tRNA ligase beta subunit-related protein n=1 Tax=Streptomyces griseoincarnatus TaxID=29305 RepID=A0ABT0W1J0_STRGI|nr:phenylalanine--tRNA ligase beta subunit-related protein [Streptomyces griseoincarnatus]MCM2516714.1 phenylalanine--tRNA ligase beta subunit-related protein [Streptomyces griseoincarnatus]
MILRHAEEVRAAHPGLAAGALHATGVDGTADVEARVAEYTSRALTRLADDPESRFPEVLAWRRAFARTGLRPTQYRCASESLLRRLRKEGSLPRIHPVVDLCNAVSVAYAVPIAVLDVDRITGPLLEVRPARGDEEYTTFDGRTEHPAPGEVTYADSAGRAHARRWTNRQSGHSAVRDGTRRVLVVAEAMHEGGADTVARVLESLAEELGARRPVTPVTALLTDAAPEFTFGDAARVP